MVTFILFLFYCLSLVLAVGSHQGVSLEKYVLFSSVVVIQVIQATNDQRKSGLCFFCRLLIIFIPCMRSVLLFQ